MYAWDKLFSVYKIYRSMFKLAQLNLLIRVESSLEMNEKPVNSSKIIKSYRTHLHTKPAQSSKHIIL